MEPRREETTLTNASIFAGDSLMAAKAKQREYVETEEEKTSVRRGASRKKKGDNVMSVLKQRVVRG